MTAISKIDTVIFDVGNVLYQWDLRCLFEKLIDDAEELDWFLLNVITPEWHFQHDAGRPLAEMVPERISQFPQYESHIKAYATRFNETIPGPVAGSLQLVKQLVSNGVPIFGITNFGSEFWRGFRPTAKIFDSFSDIIVSGDEKLVKPDTAIYELALDRFDVTADQCLFIDDRPENVAGSEKLGMRGHYFRDARTLEQELKALKLL
ncbi:HAD family phosphatase [Sphingorhabdus sp. EL138]|uniref:HAD family hydrolase n=1 Tax=Sphingorhabdus sp. EL138 TaxID=2073156 RepID=UPI000D68C422|nr:HAD family phosphatase [Sphingorhabdus sp. EL138]